MMKDVVRALETGGLAEIGLIAFVVAFVLMVAYALTLSKDRREEAKLLPFDEAPDAFPPHVQNGNHA